MLTALLTFLPERVIFSKPPYQAFCKFQSIAALAVTGTNRRPSRC